MTLNAPPPSKPDVFAALPRLDRHKPKCGPVRPSKAGRWRAAVLIGVHVLIGIHILQWKLGGSTLTPVEPSEAGYLLDAGKLNTGFVLFAVLIAGTLVFGRWFCGWACHVVALQDLCAWLLGKVALRPRPVRSRLLVIAPFVVAFHMFFSGTLERWWRGIPGPRVEAAFTTTELWERFPGPLMGVLTMLVVGFLIVWWLGAKGFCTYGCPYGAIFGVADRLAPGRIRVTDACDGCGHCTSVCSSNVRVHEEVAVHRMVVDQGCMKCMDCVSVCPKDALYFGFGAVKPFARSQQRIAARADFTWPEEVALGAVAYVTTQWVFRGAWLGEGVPLLLAVGLGVITAVLALAAWRLGRRPSLTFQHTVLKAERRWTRAGRWAMALLLLWLAFVVHLGAVRWAGNAACQSAAFALRGQAAAEQLEAARLDLAAVDRWSLCTDPEVLGVYGLVLRQLGRGGEAFAALTRMRDKAGVDGAARVPRAAMALAIFQRDAGDYAGARAQALAVQKRVPEDATARAMLQQLDALRK